MKSEKVNFGRRNALIFTVLFAALAFAIVSIGCASADLNDGLVAYYPFNGNANDASGNGNHGTVQGATWVDNGGCGKALSFDGRDDYVDVPLSPELTMTTNSFTVEAWVKTSDSPSKNDCIVGNYRTSTTSYWALCHLGGAAKDRGKFHFGIRDANGNGADILTLNPMNDRSWHHLVGVRDAAQGRIQFYVDGVLIGNIPATTGNVNSGQSIWIGEHLYRYFNGIIDEVRIYNYARSPSEILGDMNACRPGDTLVKKPDLEPYEITWTPSSPSTSDDITITWKVKNGGDADAEKKFYTKLYIDGKEKKSWPTDGLAVGQETSDSMNIGKLSAGALTVTVKTDATEAISESNENNNECSRTLTVITVKPILCTDPDPPSHDFGTVPNGQTRDWNFNIKNGGKGTLTWTVSADKDWITVSPTSGSTTTERDSVTVSIDTTGLECGKKYTGTITVSSNGDTKQGTITVHVPEPGEPALCTYPDSLTHDFGTVPEEQTREWSFDITNCGAGTLTWTVSADREWITVSQTSGSTTTETDTVTVSIDTTGLERGKKYTGTITVSSDGETKQGTITVYVPEPGVFPPLFYPIIYENNWNANTWDYTDTTTWTIDDHTLYYSNSLDRVLVKQIVIWYEWDSGEESVSYVIEKDGVEYQKGEFIKGGCLSSNSQWCYGRDTLRCHTDMFFPAGTYVLKLTKSKMAKNSGSNGDGFVKLLGPLNPKSDTLFYDNWNPRGCGKTDTSTWTLDKSVFVEEIRIHYNGDPDETVSYMIKKDGVEFHKGNFVIGRCYPYGTSVWCRGTDTFDKVFPAGTYVMTLSKANQCQNSQSNGNGYVRLFGVFPAIYYPRIYENNWNADTWGYTDTTTWTINKDTRDYSNTLDRVLVKQIVMVLHKIVWVSLITPLII